MGSLECTFAEEDLYDSDTKIIGGRRAWLLCYSITVLLSPKEGVLLFKVVSKDGREVASAEIVYARDVSV